MNHSKFCNHNSKTDSFIIRSKICLHNAFVYKSLSLIQISAIHNVNYSYIILGKQEEEI